MTAYYDHSVSLAHFIIFFMPKLIKLYIKLIYVICFIELNITYEFLP